MLLLAGKIAADESSLCGAPPVISFRLLSLACSVMALHCGLAVATFSSHLACPPDELALAILRIALPLIGVANIMLLLNVLGSKSKLRVLIGSSSSSRAWKRRRCRSRQRADRRLGYERSLVVPEILDRVHFVVPYT